MSETADTLEQFFPRLVGLTIDTPPGCDVEIVVTDEQLKPANDESEGPVSARLRMATAYAARLVVGYHHTAPGQGWLTLGPKTEPDVAESTTTGEHEPSTISLFISPNKLEECGVNAAGSVMTAGMHAERIRINADGPVQIRGGGADRIRATSGQQLDISETTAGREDRTPPEDLVIEASAIGEIVMENLHMYGSAALNSQQGVEVHQTAASGKIGIYAAGPIGLREIGSHSLTAHTIQGDITADKISSETIELVTSDGTVNATGLTGAHQISLRSTHVERKEKKEKT